MTPALTPTQHKAHVVRIESVGAWLRGEWISHALSAAPASKIEMSVRADAHPHIESARHGCGATEIDHT